MPIRADGIQLGQSPRFTAITADSPVRGSTGDKGILVAITITAPAGANIQLWDGPVGSGSSTLLFNVPTTLGPGTYWIYQDFKNGLHILIATAVTDCVVITGGE